MRTTGVIFYSAMLFAALTAMPSLAIDNPDAPDHIGEFRKRAQEYETLINQRAKTTQDTLEAYADYEKFLDKELNQAYKALSVKLGVDQLAKIKQSQRNWLRYRDSEFDFIAKNWTIKNFGSSSVLSRGDYRTSLIRDRVILLLSYLKNYPKWGRSAGWIFFGRSHQLIFARKSERCSVQQTCRNV